MKKTIRLCIVGIILGIILVIAGYIVLRATGGYTSDIISYEEVLPDDKEIHSIYISAYHTDFNVKQGDTYRLTAENVSDNTALHLTEKNGVLNIDTEKKVTKSFPPTDINFSTSNFSFCFNNNTCGKYTLYLPKKVYDEFTCDTAFADIDINDLSCEKAAIDTSFSSVSFSNFDVTKSIDADCSFGECNLNMSNSTFEKLDIDTSFGEFNLNNAEISKSCSIDSSFGETSLNLYGENYKLSKDNCFGEINISGNTSSNGNVEIDSSNSFGEINITIK